MEDTVYVIGNGESRAIYPIDELSEHGDVFGCNAIYRDHPKLCDKIFAADGKMHQELVRAKSQGKFDAVVMGPDDISDWNYILPEDGTNPPMGVKLYRQWTGGDVKTGKYKTRDFSTHKGSGCSAVLHAAEQGYKRVCIVGFDILGARQWTWKDTVMSRENNNMYKGSENYPARASMKAYLKYEWLYHLAQTFRKFKSTQFYFFNRQEYIVANSYIPRYFGLSPLNIRAGIYADLRRFTQGDFDRIGWYTFEGQVLTKQQPKKR